MTSIDIQTPLRHKRFIRGDVIRRILAQGVDFSWYVDASEDVSVAEEDVAMLDQVTSSTFWRNHMLYMVKILAKRNRLRSRGTSEFVYLCDADVCLPSDPVLPGMLAAFERNASLGATGVVYAIDWPFLRDHVGAGSLLLRRSDYLEIGDLRGTPCECAYIRSRLACIGKETVALTAVHAHQWKRTNIEGERPVYEQKEEQCPRCGEVRNPLADSDYTDVHYTTNADGLLPSDYLRELVDAHGETFRLFVEH